ncbi:MAG: tetratricopeptide repeat protein, partial [Candidatus Brocadiales bacterium]|nr:tetratricopeptide repeat protein [Candidatus Brocadiales bacterium]
MRYWLIILVLCVFFEGKSGLASEQPVSPGEAIEKYRALTEKNPFDPEAFLNLGNAYAQKGMYPEAIEGYKKALELYPEFAEVHLRCGDVYLQLGDLDKSVYEYHQAMRVDAGLAEAYQKLAVI